MSELRNRTSPRLNYVVCSSTSGLHNMAYWEWGDPSNSQVLLCVHGLTRTGRDFDAFAQAMSSDYRVVCPDIVGRGRSDWLVDPDNYTVPQYVADIITLIARLQPSTLDWVGTSMGALIGLGVAGALASSQRMKSWRSDSNLNPQQDIPFRRMVINDVGPVISLEGLARIGNYVGEELLFDSFDEVINYAKRQWASFGEYSEEQWKHLVRFMFKEHDGQWALTYDLRIAIPFQQQFLEQKESESKAIIQLAQQILWDAFETLPAETLIIRGEHSDLLSAQTAQEMLLRQPKASLFEVKNCGHAPMLMHESQIQTVKQFLLKG